MARLRGVGRRMSTIHSQESEGEGRALCLYLVAEKRILTRHPQPTGIDIRVHEITIG